MPAQAEIPSPNPVANSQELTEEDRAARHAAWLRKFEEDLPNMEELAVKVDQARKENKNLKAFLQASTKRVHKYAEAYEAGKPPGKSQTHFCLLICIYAD